MNLETFKKAEKLRQRIEGLKMMKSYLHELFARTNQMGIKVSFEFFGYSGATPLDHKISSNYSPMIDKNDFKIIGDAIDKKIQQLEVEFSKIATVYNPNKI